MRVGWVDDPRFELHEQEDGHPESPERVRSIRKALRSAPFFGKLVPIAAREATRAELQLVHAPAYVDFVEACCLDAEPAVLGPDVRVCGGSWPAALLAAGSAIEATRRVLAGELDRAFLNIRPPGHHAGPDSAMGFCIFNNVALAARWALELGGVRKLAVVDWDVHHGNGTQDIFRGEGRVLYVSMHHHPFYPGTGAARQTDNALSLPMPAGSGDAKWMEVFERKAAPALKSFEPELLLISCGFDAHAGDPLGGMRLSAAGYAALTRSVCALSEGRAKGRVISMLEGGYDMQALAESARAHVEALFN